MLIKTTRKAVAARGRAGRCATPARWSATGWCSGRRSPATRTGLQRVSGAQLRIPVPVPRAELAAALDAVLGNVFRYTPQGTAFEVAVSRRDGYVAVRVDDAGPGIADPDRALRRGASDQGSTGLGPGHRPAGRVAGQRLGQHRPGPAGRRQRGDAAGRRRRRRPGRSAASAWSAGWPASPGHEGQRPSLAPPAPHRRLTGRPRGCAPAQVFLRSRLTTALDRLRADRISTRTHQFHRPSAPRTHGRWSRARGGSHRSPHTHAPAARPAPTRRPVQPAVARYASISARIRC